jgi:cytohesin
VLAFAEESAKATASIEGEALYARVALCTLNWEGENTFLDQYEFEWPRIRQGCRDVLKRYPDTNFWLNVFCEFACLYEDRKTAAELFAKIGDNVHGDAWASQHEFTKWAEWAAGKGANPRKNPLEAAVRDGNVGRVQKLLDAGHDPNGLARSGKSMLQVAVDEEQYRIVQVLLDAGADVNRVAPEGAPAILKAARIEGDDTYLRLLLAHKANPNAADRRGWTPLLNVLANRETGKALLLLDHGADPNLAMNEWTPLHYAAEHGYSEVAMKLLEKGADPDAPDANDYSPLCYAALAGNINLCRAMLEKDADPNISEKNGWTLLLEMVKRGNLELVKLFVSKGGDLDRMATDGTGAFDAAAESGSLPMLEYLLGLNPDGLRAVAKDGRTLLHTAADHGHGEMVKVLLDKGLDPNARTGEGLTPLGAALKNNHKDVADLLRARGAAE